MTAEKTAITFADKLKWLVILLLLSGSIAANYWYRDWNFSLRLVAWIILLGIQFGIAATTTQGKQVILFSKESRSELRRVVWPTRQETIRTTIMVMVLILIVGLMLWGVDSVLLWAVSLVTK